MSTITLLAATDNGSVSRGVINTNFTNLNTDLVSVGTTVENETPAGSINDLNVTFTLAHTPIVNSVKLYKNGSRLSIGAGNDYTLSGLTITFTSAPTTLPQADKLIADYRY